MFRKADVQRLKGMLKALDDSEARFQELGQPVIPRSMRAVDMLNAEALRNVLAVLEAAREYKLIPARCTEQMEDAYDDAIAAAGFPESCGLFMPAYDAMIAAAQTPALRLGKRALFGELMQGVQEMAEHRGEAAPADAKKRNDVVIVKVDLLRRTFAPCPDITDIEAFQAWSDDYLSAHDELRALLPGDDA